MIKWKREDVIEKFKEAMASPELGTEHKPKVLQNWIDKAKAKFTPKPVEGEEEV